MPALEHFEDQNWHNFFDHEPKKHLIKGGKNWKLRKTIHRFTPWCWHVWSKPITYESHIATLTVKQCHICGERRHVVKHFPKSKFKVNRHYFQSPFNNNQ